MEMGADAAGRSLSLSAVAQNNISLSVLALSHYSAIVCGALFAL
jgi:hypothetical protein